jgi:hypothetical protein
MQRKNSDKRLQNLKPFPKGISGNPAGKPRKVLLSDALRRHLALAAPGMPEKHKPRRSLPSSQKLLPAMFEANLWSDFHAWQYARKQEEPKKT